MSIETRSFDPAVYVETEDGMAAYLDEAFATNDPAFVADALGIVMRAAGAAGLAGRRSMSRESLALAGSAGNPDVKTIMQVLSALGLRLTVAVAERQTADEHAAESSAG